MRACSFLVFVFCVVLVPGLHGELVQVIQLGRHGARTPNSFEYLPNQFEEEQGQLTALGLVQEYYLGQEMRKRYIENSNFLSEDFNPSEVLIRSSWKNRTLRSTYAFINGLYPQEDGEWYHNKYADEFPIEDLLPLRRKQNNVDREDIMKVKINEEWAREVIDVVSMEGDLHFHAAKPGNCKPAEQIFAELKRSREAKEMENYLNVVLYEQLATTVNSELGFDLLKPMEMTLKKAKSVLDNYRCNKFHGQEHPDIDEHSLEILKKLRYFYAYKLMLADDLMRSIQATRLLSEFLEFTKGIKEGVQDTPKYIFYSAHDTNLEILFSIFLLESVIANDEQYNIIPFSSVLSMEIHKEKETAQGLDGPEEVEEHYVKMFFNDEPQLIKWCKSFKCPLKQFHRILEHYIVPSIEDFCSVGRIIANVSTTPTCEKGSFCEAKSI